MPEKNGGYMTKRLLYHMLFLTILALPFRASPPSQTAQTQQAKTDEGKYTVGGHLKKPSAYSGVPVVGEFQGTQIEAASDRERRQIREKRYSNTNLPRPVADPSLLVDGQSETANIRFIDYVTVGKSSDPRGIPVSVSTAVV